MKQTKYTLYLVYQADMYSVKIFFVFLFIHFMEKPEPHY